MIINSRKDLDNAPQDVREKFMHRLAWSINKYEWDGSDWKLAQDDGTLVKFGFTTADFPDAPVPEKPDYNPDERESEHYVNEARIKRDALLSETDWTQLGDVGFSLERLEAWQTYRQALRDITKQDGFPFDIKWPTPPGEPVEGE